MTKASCSPSWELDSLCVGAHTKYLTPKDRELPSHLNQQHLQALLQLPQISQYLLQRAIPTS